MTEQRDYGDENDACNGKCTSRWLDPQCPKHGDLSKPQQLTLESPHANPKFYDPSEADIPY